MFSHLFKFNWATFPLPRFAISSLRFAQSIFDLVPDCVCFAEKLTHAMISKHID